MIADELSGTANLDDLSPAVGQGFWSAPGPGALASGWLLGCAWQLQQARLWHALAYAALFGVCLIVLLVWLGPRFGPKFNSFFGRFFGRFFGCIDGQFFGRFFGRLFCPAVGPSASPLRRCVWHWLLAIAVPCGLGLGCTGLRAVDRLAAALPASVEGRDIRLEGYIDSLPQAVEGGYRFEFAVNSAVGGPDLGEALPPAALAGLRRVQLSWYGAVTSAQTKTGPDEGARNSAQNAEPASIRTMPVLRAGDRWDILVRLKAPHGLANPWGPDPELGAWERGIQAWGHVRQGPRDRAPVPMGSACAVAGGTEWWPCLDRLRQSVRDDILARVPDRSAAGVLAALVVGDQGAILAADWALYRATGIAHLVSISGLHITVFAWAAALAIGVAWRRSVRLCEAWPAPHAAALGGLLLAGAYAAFSGGGVPAQRTLGMLAVAALLRLSGRRWPWPAGWALVAAAVCAWDPWALLQAGFWLSFVAVGILMGAAPGDLPVLRGRWHRAQALLREQAVITLALAPLTLLLFGQVSVVGLVANLVAIPWMTCIVLPLALAGLLWPTSWQGAAWAVQGLGWGLQGLAALPGAVLALPQAPTWMGAAALAGAALAVLRLPLVLRLAGLPLALPLLLWQPPRPGPGQFDVLAMDIGQGQAVLVRTAGHALLYDAGPRWGEEVDAGQRVVAPGLRAMGVALDRLVVSHPDADHAGGAASVLADQPRADLLASLPAGHALALVRPPMPCLQGQRWSWDGVLFEVLHPQERDLMADPGLRHPNAHSCLLRIQGQGGAVALLTGDLEAPQELRLVQESAPALRADLLLVPHHGSRTSSSDPWLAAVQPQVALVQAGYRNRYGHPAAPVMARYAAHGIAVVATPSCGAALWVSSQPGRVECHRAGARRYWWHQPEAVGTPVLETDLDPDTTVAR